MPRFAPQQQPPQPREPAGAARAGAARPAAGGVRAADPLVEEVLRSPGQPLDAPTRAFLEPRFGHDFSHVRVHSDGRAAQSAAALGARAWTFGRDVVFGSGLYAPSTPRGAGLLAHELAHVVQQSGLGRSAAAPEIEIGEAGEAQERAARAHDTALAAGSTPVSLAPLPSPRVQLSAWNTFLDALLYIPLFIPRLFGLEYFTSEDLREYLSGLRQRKAIEGGWFSDNKARACVKREAELGPYDAQTKILLIQEMLDGYTSFLDRDAILTLLRRSAAERQQIVAAVGRDRLWSKFGGDDRRVLEALTMTAADAGEALVERLRKLAPEEIQDYIANAADPAVAEAARRAAALARITAPVPAAAAVTPAGEAHLNVNGWEVVARPDQINPALGGNRANTNAEFGWTHLVEVEDTPEHANEVVQAPQTRVTVTLWTEFPSADAKTQKSSYGVGTRQQDQPTLRYHERGHGEAYLTFLRNNPAPVFAGDNMHPAQYNAAIRQWNAAMNDIRHRAVQFSFQMTDCVGTLPTDKDLEGTGFTVAMCRQQ
jgi:hypothetical protein